MSRSKNNNDKDLQSEIRQLKEENKALKRQLKAIQKEFRNEYDLEDLIQEDIDSKKSKAEKCPICARGYLQVTELGKLRKIVTCTVCDQYRKVIKS